MDQAREGTLFSAPESTNLRGVAVLGIRSLSENSADEWLSRGGGPRPPDPAPVLYGLVARDLLKVC